MFEDLNLLIADPKGTMKPYEGRTAPGTGMSTLSSVTTQQFR